MRAGFARPLVFYCHTSDNIEVMKEATMFIFLFITSVGGYLFFEEKLGLSKYETLEPKVMEHDDSYQYKSQVPLVSEDESGVDSLGNILKRKQRLDKVVSTLDLSGFEVLDYCESCRIHERDFYVYDKNTDRIDQEWESVIKFKIDTGSKHPTLESLTEKLEEFGYASDAYPGFQLNSAGGWLGSSETLGLTTKGLNEAEVVKIYEKNVLDSDSGESLNDWKVDYNIIEISVPNSIDLALF